MKLFSIIISIYIIALSCLPCADMEVNSLAHTTTKFTANHEDHSHDKENDLCSPFCICSCCGSQVVSLFHIDAINFPILFKGIKTQLPTYKSVFASNFYGSIWQPPQKA